MKIVSRGHLAVSIGSYHLRLSLAEGRIEDRGKYMTVWRKIDGQWRVAADMINTDAQLPVT
jgi:ketosteroid isomerase-like protein